jgi:hypothetical protein
MNAQLSRYATLRDCHWRPGEISADHRTPWPRVEGPIYGAVQKFDESHHEVQNGNPGLDVDSPAIWM